MLKIQWFFRMWFSNFHFIFHSSFDFASNTQMTRDCEISQSPIESYIYGHCDISPSPIDSSSHSGTLPLSGCLIKDLLMMYNVCHQISSVPSCHHTIFISDTSHDLWLLSPTTFFYYFKKKYGNFHKGKGFKKIRTFADPPSPALSVGKKLIIFKTLPLRFYK